MGFFIFLIVGAVIFYNVLQKGKEKQEQWRKAAERLGLGYYPGGIGTLGKISGLKGGHLVEISTFSRTHNNSTSVYTRYKIRYNTPIQTDFRMVRQTALHKSEAMFGLQDIEVGDPMFDDHVLVRGMYPEKVIAFLTPARRKAVVQLVESYVTVVITNEGMELEKSGRDFSPGAIYNTGRLMLSVSNELTDNSPSLADEERHTIEINEEPSSAPILTAEKKPKEADFADAWEGPPIQIDPDPAAEEPVVEQPAEEFPEPEPIETPAAPAAEQEGPVLALQSIAEHLYGGGSGTLLQSGALFQEHYENRTVIGKGTLKRVGKFSYDPVFTNTAGIKASFDICELAGPYSKIKVVADIMYPVERYAELKAKVGTSLPVSGKLIAQNSTLTQLYLVHD